jgi:hypothetical protein
MASRRNEEAQTAALQLDAGRLMEPEVLDDPEHIIGAILKRDAQRDPESLTRAILEQLWEAGYDVRPVRY